ncbi:RecE family exodeoxyribonuclease [Buttiauxella sp. S19-1]|uniref:RecE family exodeoxyribonuclease n=1 Tax=Buttiauxella sp. S19-1 TaxID=941430 RepID=UPI001EDBAE2F|nr:RecE family exodeoxyribonuclease [Buttiauxella sp. S19-1]
MSDMPQEIALYQKVKNESARKRLNIKAAFFWCTSKKESLAQSRMALALDEAGFNDDDFAKPVRVNLPIVSDLPLEGVLDTTFCDRYQIGDDGMTFGLILGAAPLGVHNNEKVVAGTDSTVEDANTAIAPLDATLPDPINEDSQGANATLPDEQATPELRTVPTLPFRQRVLAHLLSSEYRYHVHVDRGEMKEIIRLEMDTDETYAQNLLLACANIEALHTYPDFNLYTAIDAVKNVFPVGNKAPLLGDFIAFLTKYVATDHIDRKLMIQAWIKGDRNFVVKRNDAGLNAGGNVLTDRGVGINHDMQSLSLDVALGKLARSMDFDIYNLEGPVYRRAKEIRDTKPNYDDEYLAWLGKVRKIAGVLDYSRASIIAMIKTAPDDIWRTPGALQGYINSFLTETDHANPLSEIVAAACGTPPTSSNESQPKVTNLGDGKFSIDGLINSPAPETASNGGEKEEVALTENTSDVQIQEDNSDEIQAGDALQPGESSVVISEEIAPVIPDAAEILAANAPHLANHNEVDVNQNTDFVAHNDDSVNQVEPAAPEIMPEVDKVEPVVPESSWPTFFEPGRYEDIPNDVYHGSNGVSSTMLKDARVSLMYFNGRHVIKTIPREQSDALLRGNIIHTYVLEPEKFADEFGFPEDMPDEVLCTSSDFVAIIKEYNASLPALKTPDELKQWIESYNSELTPPLSVSGNMDETGQLYASLPEKFQRLPESGKHTSATMKACIKEYNASLPPLLKTSGSREQLLDQIATVAPDVAEAERAKFLPYNISGTKEQLTEVVKAIRPNAVTAEDFHKQQEVLCQGKTMISLDMYEQAKNISAALQQHPGASRLLNHPSRKSEVSYFGIDDDTGLELRVRPDAEVTIGTVRIGGDLKTLGIQNVKQERLRDRIHREIIERDYHLSAAMYCDVASLDQFFWIFVNKEPGYHWVAVVEASSEMLELGRLEYKRTLNLINDAYESGNWPAPIAEDYTDELNDFDLRRLENLRTA